MVDKYNHGGKSQGEASDVQRHVCAQCDTRFHYEPSAFEHGDPSKPLCEPCCMRNGRAP